MSSIQEVYNNSKGNIECDLGTIHHFSDNLYAKQMNIPAGFQAVTHIHNYSHLSVLAKGKVVVTTDADGSVEYTAPACIEIKKGVPHGILALEDTTWFCVHSTPETDLDLIDDVLIAHV